MRVDVVSLFSDVMAMDFGVVIDNWVVVVGCRSDEEEIEDVRMGDVPEVAVGVADTAVEKLAGVLRVEDAIARMEDRSGDALPDLAGPELSDCFSR